MRSTRNASAYIHSPLPVRLQAQYRVPRRTYAPLYYSTGFRYRLLQFNNRPITGSMAYVVQDVPVDSMYMYLGASLAQSV